MLYSLSSLICQLTVPGEYECIPPLGRSRSVQFSFPGFAELSRHCIRSISIVLADTEGYSGDSTPILSPH